MLPFIEQHWFDLFQSLFILAGFLITTFALKNDVRAWKVEHLLNINQSYKSIWEKTFRNPDLSRILKKDLDLKAHPITFPERQLARELILHIYVVFEAERNKQLVIGDMSKDIYDVLHLPIPRTVWKEVKQYQQKNFVKFIEDLLSKKKVETVELV